MKTFKINIFLFSFLTSFHLYSHKSLPERITALHEVTRKLIRYTLPIPEKLDKTDPLYTPHYRLMVELLEKKPDIVLVKTIISESTSSQIDEGELYSPLMACAVFGHNAIMDLLLAKQTEVNGHVAKININQRNRTWQTAAMFAAMANNNEGLIKLINADADLLLKDRHDGDAYDYALSHGNDMCRKTIIDALLTKNIRRD